MPWLDEVLSPKVPAADTNMEPEKVKELATRSFRKKKLKVNMHIHVGTRVKYADEGNAGDPLASLAKKVDLSRLSSTSMFLFRLAFVSLSCRIESWYFLTFSLH